MTGEYRIEVTRHNSTLGGGIKHVKVTAASDAEPERADTVVATTKVGPLDKPVN